MYCTVPLENDAVDGGTKCECSKNPSMLQKRLVWLSCVRGGGGAGVVYVARTVQITFIFIGQTHLVFGKRVCTCVMKHSNAFRTFLNWLKNSKRVWHERKLHIMRVPLFANFDR